MSTRITYHVHLDKRSSRNMRPSGRTGKSDSKYRNVSTLQNGVRGWRAARPRSKIWGQFGPHATSGTNNVRLLRLSKKTLKSGRWSIFSKMLQVGIFLNARLASFLQHRRALRHSGCWYGASDHQPGQRFALHFLFPFLHGIFESFGRTVSWQGPCNAISNISLFWIF
jgi:hypothetical protein